MRSFEIYGKWSVQASIGTHTLPQCSHASVGLTQACPNKNIDWIHCNNLASDFTSDVLVRTLQCTKEPFSTNDFTALFC